MKLAFASAIIATVTSAFKHAAVLVAGSNGYWNYRHQADIAHAYQLRVKGGMSPDDIIVFMYHDIANNS